MRLATYYGRKKGRPWHKLTACQTPSAAKNRTEAIYGTSNILEVGMGPACNAVTLYRREPGGEWVEV